MSKIAKRYDVTDCNSPDAILEKCGLNWEPELRVATYQGGSDTDNGFRAVVNPITSKALAFTGKRFAPNSHVRAVNDLATVMRHGTIAPHGVSVWDGGGKIAFQFRCPDLDVRIGAKSVVSPLLTLVVNHDSGGSDRSFFADFDFWCRNQGGMVAKIQGEGIRHSGDILTRFGDLVETRILDVRTGLTERYSAMKRMADSPVRLIGRPLLSYFATALDIPQDEVAAIYEGKKDANGKVEVLSHDGKVLKRVVDAWRTDDNGAQGTVWHAMSAVTRYTTHNEGRSEGVRMLKSLTGHTDRYARAFAAAAALVS